MQPESRFKQKVNKRLKAIDGIWFGKVQQVALRGWPDVLICFRGHFIAWELKVPPNKVKPGSLQEHILGLIDKAGGIAREVTPANLDACIEELLCLPLKIGFQGSSQNHLSSFQRP